MIHLRVVIRSAELTSIAKILFEEIETSGCEVLLIEFRPALETRDIGVGIFTTSSIVEAEFERKEGLVVSSHILYAPQDREVQLKSLWTRQPENV